MSDFTPEDEPIVFEAESIIHGAYIQREQQQALYTGERDSGLLLLSVGSAALVSAGTMVQAEASRYSFAPHQMGYLFGALGAGSVVCGAFLSAKALLTRRQLQ